LLDVRIAVEHLEPDEGERSISPVHGDQEPAVGESGPVGVRFLRWRVRRAVYGSPALWPRHDSRRSIAVRVVRSGYRDERQDVLPAVSARDDCRNIPILRRVETSDTTYRVSFTVGLGH